MKRKVTDLKLNEAILISNDFERDAILQLMEDAGMRWIDCNPTEYKPNFGYPFYLFTYDFDGENRLCTSLNSYDLLTYPATDFIGSEFSGNGLTVTEPDNTISITLPKFDQAIKLLRDLADIQNGAPLEQHRAEWEQTMDEVYTFLNEHEPRNTPPNEQTTNENN
jgi:hypothetical protein